MPLPPLERQLLLGFIFDHLVDAVVTVSRSNRIVAANQATFSLFGYTEAELLGMELSQLMPERYRAAHRHGVEAYMQSGGQVRRTEGYVDVIGLTRDGREIPMSLSMACTHHNGELFLTGVLRDMSELAQAQATIRRQLDELRAANLRLQEQAERDPLTGVLNRRALQRVIDEQWAAACADRCPLAVMLCDIDHFKRYNDTYGHLEGDRCLKAVAEALTRALGAHGTVARFGGEEFLALIHPGAPLTAESAAAQAQAVVRAMGLPHAGSPDGHGVTVSIGVAVQQPHHDRPDALIRHADDALYLAKRTRDRYVVWSPQLLGGAAAAPGE